jgi:predicted transcriptional regulator
LTTVRIIEFIFVALVIVAVAITAVVTLRWVNDAYMKQDAAPEEGAGQPGAPQTESFEEGARLALTDAQMVAEPGPLDHPALTAMKDYAPFILPIAWGAVAGAVIWRGKVRSQWSRQGYDYDTFRLVAKMRGSATRQKLLEAIRNGRKNKLQLANELGLDWKTVDNHVDMLLNARLVVEDGVEGTARFYSITENGRRVLLLLEQGESP